MSFPLLGCVRKYGHLFTVFYLYVQCVRSSWLLSRLRSSLAYLLLALPATKRFLLLKQTH